RPGGGDPAGVGGGGQDAAGVVVLGADGEGDAVVLVEHRQPDPRLGGQPRVEQVLGGVDRPAGHAAERVLVLGVGLGRVHVLAGVGGGVVHLAADPRAGGDSEAGAP